MNHFDAVIIGSGQAAPSLAVGLANRGQSVALIEGDKLGGTCVNSGCTPTKTLRKSARVAHMVRRAADFGVSTGAVTVDFPAAMARMRERVDTARRNALNLTLPYRTYANVACFGAVVGSFCLAGCGIDCGPWRPGYRAMPPMPERCRAGTRRGWA